MFTHLAPLLTGLCMLFLSNLLRLSFPTYVFLIHPSISLTSILAFVYFSSCPFLPSPPAYSFFFQPFLFLPSIPSLFDLHNYIFIQPFHTFLSSLLNLLSPFLFLAPIHFFSSILVYFSSSLPIPSCSAPLSSIQVSLFLPAIYHSSLAYKSFGHKGFRGCWVSFVLWDKFFRTNFMCRNCCLALAFDAFLRYTNRTFSLKRIWNLDLSDTPPPPLQAVLEPAAREAGNIRVVR